MAYECVSHICSAICSCLLGFNFHQEQRPETLLIQTSSVTTDTQAVPSSASALSSSPPSGKITYDVFLSFRGTDTRSNFTDHLYTALKQKGITTFRDNEELERGESIGPNLLKAIEESRYVIVVFSKNYADSPWCLDEIAKVADCMNAMGQKVLPVFYHVDPTEVRRQTGDPFRKAFQKHQRRYKGDPDKVKRWRDALVQVGGLSGWHLQDGYETKVIQEIVEKIFTGLNEKTSMPEGLVGMDSHLNEMLSYLDIGCPDVRILGICGMGGIGKSTIAHVVSKRVKALFEGDSFLENVREVTEKQGAVHLQQQLLLNLLKTNVHLQTSEMGKDIIKSRLRTKKVLLILDNVDQDEQLETLCDREWFGSGSRIIITTRDEHLLREADKVYKVDPLTDNEALQLFCMKAFKKQQVIGEDFLKLSKEFLKFANGLPLAIKVLGSSVHGKNVKLWSSALDRLKKNPPKNIIDVLKHSFDGLEETEKEIFLDVACFFKGGQVDLIINVLQGGGYRPEIDIDVLVKKSLVTLFGRKLEMHDLLQELGREIVRHECCEDPGKRSRLWLPNEIIHVLSRTKGTSAVQGIFLQYPTESDVVHSIENAFSKMDRLRLLVIRNVKFSGNITYLSSELQYLDWQECHLDFFPPEFQPDKLVEIQMYNSHIKQLWKGGKGWSMLQYINLTGSQYLMSTPDFTEVPELETLVLQDCTNLVEIHPSLGFLKKLKHLDLRNCKSIESIPPFIALESLEMLLLSFCSGLKTFPEIAGNMNSSLQLDLEGTNIWELPSSIECLTGLTLLDLTDCKNLLHLPSTIRYLTSLKSLYLNGCSKLDAIAENLNGMECLETLVISGTSISELSFIVGMKNLQFLSCKGCKCLVPESFRGLASLSLTELDLSYCNLMDGAFLNDLSTLTSLGELHLCGNWFVRLPENISQLSMLETLHLNNCRQLQLLPKKLPSSLLHVHARDCTSLTDYPNQIKVLTTSKLGVTTLDSRHQFADSSENGEGCKHHPLPNRRLVEMSTSSSIFRAEDEIPEWFGNISTRNSVSIPIPENLTFDNKWKGFVTCAIFSVKGYTGLSIIQPDRDFSSYSYQMTLDTDVMRLEPVVCLMKDYNPSFGSTSHLLVTFNISRFEGPGWAVYGAASVVKAIFETTNPSMVVKKCAIRLVFDQDEGWDSKIYPLHQIRESEEDISVLESSWLNHHSEWEKFIPPSEEESAVLLRKNLESVLPRYLEAAVKHSLVTFSFNLRGSPGWFHEESTFAPDMRQSFTMASVKLPENLHKNKKWMGFAIFASVVQEVGQTFEGKHYKVYVGLRTGDTNTAPHWTSQKFNHIMPLAKEYHSLLFFYVLQAELPETLFTQTEMDLGIMIVGSPLVKVQRFGFRFVYQEDIQGFSDTIIWCMKRDDSLELHNKLFVEKWIHLIRCEGAPLKRMTERDSRTPRQKYIDLYSQKYIKYWDWSDPRSFVCGFERAEISKWKRFMPFITEGNYAECQLPLDVFDDDNWLGFAAYTWLSHDHYPDISLGTALDSENVVLHHRLHADVEWNGLFDYSIRTLLPKLKLTWFHYLPRTLFRSKIWRQCKLARVTMQLTDNLCLTVHSCALRLVYKKDIEHLVEALILAELP